MIERSRPDVRVTAYAEPVRQGRSIEIATLFASLPLLACLMLALGGCSSTPRSFGEGLAMKAEQAHNAKAWRAKQALAADIVVQFGGNTMLEGRMITDPHVGHTRIERSDGTVYVFDGTTGWVSPAANLNPRARFHMLTWPYFLAVPFKLRDPGSHLAPVDSASMPSMQYPDHTGKLTFGEGVGDAPDDWYIVCLDPRSNRVVSMAYIVSYGRNDDPATIEPHAITYESFVEVDGVTLSNHWLFWDWSPTEGIHGDPRGEVTLKNMAFIEPDAAAFVKPAGAAEATMPSQ